MPGPRSLIDRYSQGAWVRAQVRDGRAYAEIACDLGPRLAAAGGPDEISERTVSRWVRRQGMRSDESREQHSARRAREDPGPAPVPGTAEEHWDAGLAVLRALAEEEEAEPQVRLTSARLLIEGAQERVRRDDRRSDDQALLEQLTERT